MIYHLLSESEHFSEGTGGAISRWVANVTRRGSEIVVCPRSDSSWGFPEQRVFVMPGWGATSPVHPLLFRIPWSLQRLTYLRVFRPLLSRLRRGDIVYVHNAPESASVLATVAGAYGFSVVLHMHNSHLTLANGGQLDALRDIPIILVSKFLQKELEHALPGHFRKTYVIHNGADHEKFCPGPPQEVLEPTVVFTGRLVPYKGVHVLLAAMRILYERKIGVRCKIAGRSHYASNRHTRYSRYLTRITPPNTELIGYKTGTEVADLLRESQIYCCPSIWHDPFPLAPIEAMASGLPVVGTESGGIPEILQYGGGTLAPRNDVRALADAIEFLVANVSARIALGRQAREVVERYFVWAHVRSQYDHILATC
jgi:spore coat protein SA